MDFVNDVIKSLPILRLLKEIYMYPVFRMRLGIEKRTFNAQLDTYMSRRSRAEKGQIIKK